MNPEVILSFWFDETDHKKWWVKDPDFDSLIRDRFGDLLTQASRGELYSWRSGSRGRLAEIIVLDQFSRNIHRGTAGAFSSDVIALVLAQEAIAAGSLNELSPIECNFLLMPFMHSESPVIHARAEQLYGPHAPGNNLEFELKHKAIVDRFGRYPHRNAILGRVSTDEEIEFLKGPGSSF
ncbi:DUF924 family protein [Dokdonella sp.]|uniref:DUF924 family protein n=1 Tax=Dokdonella sp. TaxID=2291710 RepID=UPI003C35A9C7